MVMVAESATVGASVSDMVGIASSNAESVTAGTSVA